MLRIYLAFKVRRKRGSQIEFVAGPLKTMILPMDMTGQELRLNPLNHWAWYDVPRYTKIENDNQSVFLFAVYHTEYTEY